MIIELEFLRRKVSTGLMSVSYEQVYLVIARSGDTREYAQPTLSIIHAQGCSLIKERKELTRPSSSKLVYAEFGYIVRLGITC